MADMAVQGLLETRAAPGGPGPLPQWGPGSKQGFGTAASRSSRLWFTLAGGNLSEVFYPRLDRPVLHSLRFLVAAAGSPPIEDAWAAEHEVNWLRPRVPAFTVKSAHAEYVLQKEFIPHAELSGMLIAGRFEPRLPDLQLWVEARLHMSPSGRGNHASVLDLDKPVLIGRQDEGWLAVVGPFSRATAGYVGASDVAIGLEAGSGAGVPAYGQAGPGNVALGAEVGLPTGPFQIALGFGGSPEEAESSARAVLATGLFQVRIAFEQGWLDLDDVPPELVRVSADEGALARASLTVLRSLEDKSFPGAFVAAPAAPWGEREHEGDHVYHLVWPRDLFQIATALIDAGDVGAAQRALRHLEAQQRPDGSWPQNATVDGREHWRGLELDQVAYPILLAWRLGLVQGLDHDPYAMVRRAAIFLVTHGPATPLDRWEDAGGLSPSTLAAAVAALAAAEEFAYDAGDHLAAAHLRVVADYWCDRVESWCFDTGRQAYVRLGNDPDQRPGPEAALGVEQLELVRRGLRRADDPRISASLAALDAELRVETPRGAAWRRYSGDKYGEKADGTAWDASGRGRPWPLLAGERAHLELAAGRGAGEGIRALEAFAGQELLIPEQVWEEQPIPGGGARGGHPTGSVRPLGWAHAEYLKLLRATASGGSADVVGPARDRYAQGEGRAVAFVWSHAHPIRVFWPGRAVKVQLPASAVLHWTLDGWHTRGRVESRDTGLGLHVAELPTEIMRPGAVMEWTAEYADSWEGRTYSLTCRAG